MDKYELLATIRRAHERLGEVMDELSDEQLAERALEDWTRKDLIAHIGWWEGHSADVLEALLAGREPYATGEPWSLDEQNARVHAEWQERPAGEVRSFERDAYRRLVGLLESATDADLFEATRFRWTDGEPLAETIRSDTDRHYEEHLEQLRPSPA